MKENTTKPSIVEICDIPVVNTTRELFSEFAAYDMKECKSPFPKICFSLNGESLSDYHCNKVFREVFKCADYVHADGMSIVNISRILKVKNLRGRIATTDWFHDIAKISAKHRIRHFFLGAKPKTVAKVVEHVRKWYPDLPIAGYHHGYFSKIEEPDIIDKINKSKTDILWIALGRPKQEIFSITWKHALKVKWIKTCGGLFDFLALEKKRAPLWIQKVNLEWAYRFSLEPKRLGSRYIRTGLLSSLIALKYLFKKTG